VRRYKHDEVVSGEVNTAFKNDTVEVEGMGSHRAVGRLKGTIRVFNGWRLRTDEWLEGLANGGSVPADGIDR
jgi:hypothetical protein